jgi:predicted alpha-1,2-mannosidase
MDMTNRKKGEKVISRRNFLTGISAVAASGLPTLHANCNSMLSLAESRSDEADVLQFVKPMIGTGGHGHTYPGATVPFGMVQLSPDTYNQGWDWCSGYHYSDDSIMGFSHTHLSGTGIGDMLDILLMPCNGSVKLVPGSRSNPEEGYRSRFSHADEQALPGYYSVALKDYKIRVELSATERAGIHRYTFPASQTSHMILDLDHGYADGPGVVRWASLRVIGKNTILGGRSTARWANGREIYFAMKFSGNIEKIEIFSDGRLITDPKEKIDGKSLKCVIHCPTASEEIILVKTGISGVSEEGALRNLDTEIPGWDFEKVRSQASEMWRKELSRVKVEGGTQREKEIFYTALYHAFVAPVLFEDADGSYRGMDGQNHKLSAGANNYSTFSLWDTYRAAHPLFTIVQPERVPSLVNCLIRMAGESPLGMPIWPLQAKETQCMTGYHSATVIAEAIRKGFPGIDIDGAYTVMEREASQSQIRGLPLYRQYGYIPCDLYRQSVSTTLDYAYNDWAIACVAKAAGKQAESASFQKRALTYRTLFDKTTGFMRPKLSSGEWAEPFASNEMGYSRQWRDYTESNPWQATFAAQHDPAGLTSLLGGREKLAEKLDGIFTASSAQPPNAPSDIAGLVGQYAHGNEPSHHIAYLYVYAGQAHKAQRRLRDLMETMYDNKPDGLAGNEDCGQMSAWYVMSAMGFYAVDPISGAYIFGTPLFDKVTVDLGEGRQFVLEADRSSSEDIYIRNIELNGRKYDKLWFDHEEITAGGRFVLKMSSKPNPEFGSHPNLAPPSASS